LGSFETLDDINIPDEIVDMTIDKDEDVDKENEPPVTPLESFPNNTLVPPIVIKKDENLHYQPESVIKTDDSTTKTPLPPTGELPEYNKSRKNKRNKRFYFDDQKHRSLHAKRLGRCMVPKQRRKKHPGLRQVLSPKALYPSAPPGYKGVAPALTIDNAKMVSHSCGGSSTSGTPMSSSSAGGSSSASSRMGSKRSNAGGSLSNNNNNNGELDLENLEYPDSPTSHKWFADNSDLSPLTVLDNINLKTEFPYSSGNIELDKPPDINSITLDSGAEHLFQFAASVPNVPDNSTTFLDIGADTFSQSLYDDLGDINMSDFPNVGAFTTAISETVIESPVFTMAPVSTNTTALTSMTFPTMTTAGQMILTKPVTLENLGDLVRLKSQHKMEGVDHAVTGNILHITTPTTSACNNQIHVSTTDHGISVLKGLIEPLPVSALKGLIKIEPTNTASGPTVNPVTATTTSSNHYGTFINGFIKIEQPDGSYKPDPMNIYVD